MPQMLLNLRLREGLYWYHWHSCFLKYFKAVSLLFSLLKCFLRQRNITWIAHMLFLLMERRISSRVSLLQIMTQSPQMHPRKYLRKMKILFILETDEGIIFYDQSLSLPLLFAGIWPEWGFQDLTYYQVWIICKPGKALPWTCNNWILGITLKAK